MENEKNNQNEIIQIFNKKLKQIKRYIITRPYKPDSINVNISLNYS